MSDLKDPARSEARIFVVVLILGAAVAAAAGDDTTRTSSIFAPVSAPADAVRTIAMLVLAITAAIAVIVGGLLAYGIVRVDTCGSVSSMAHYSPLRLRQPPMAGAIGLPERKCPALPRRLEHLCGPRRSLAVFICWDASPSSLN